MYDESLGRWTQMDPIGFTSRDENLYRYVGNDPTGWVDPSGLKTQTHTTQLTLQGKPAFALVAQWEDFILAEVQLTFFIDIKQFQSVNAAAQFLGFDHFNFLQIVV